MSDAPKMSRHKRMREPGSSTRKTQAARENGKLGGRPSKYRPELSEQLLAYFSGPATEVVTRQYVKNGEVYIVKEEAGVPFKTFGDFCRKHHVSYRSLKRWALQYPDLAHAYEMAKYHQAYLVIVNALQGYYPQRFCIFFMRMVWGWRGSASP